MIKLIVFLLCLVLCFQPEELSDVTIDNGDMGTTSTGTWDVSTGANAYGGGSLYANTIATYTYQYVITGSKSISIWHTWYNNRCSSVSVDIFDDNTLLSTITLDQSIQADAGKWKLLGTYMFNTKVKVVINSPGTCTTSADALKIQDVIVSLSAVKGFTVIIK